MKKLLCLTLTVVLVIGLFTGCVGKTDDVDAQTTEFTYWCEMPAAMASFAQSMNEMTMYQKLEEITGVKIKFVHPPAGQSKEQFNLMIASRELYDLIEYSWIEQYPGGPDKAIDDNVIIKLNDIMKNNAPNFTKLLEENPNYDKQSKTDGGYYFGFPAINPGKYRTFGGLIIRQDWLYMSIEKWSTIAIEKWSIYSLVLSHEIVSSKRWLVGLDMSKI